MRRAILLSVFTAAVCLAQSDTGRGFVNERLLRPNFLSGLPKTVPPATVAPKATPQSPAPPCLRVPWQERIPVPVNIDPKMIIPVPEKSVDPAMVIKPAPVCPDK
jgi:hypothetical protein